MSTLPASTNEYSVPPDAVFICAAGHSGSTLLDLLIGSHPAAMSLGEITQLPKNFALNTPCSCGEPIRECHLWATVLETLAGEQAFEGVRDDPYRLNLGLFEAGTVIDRAHQTRARRLWRKLLFAGAYAHWAWRIPPLTPSTWPLLHGARNKWLLFDVLARLQSRLLMVDSSKHYLDAAALYLTAPRRTKIILLVRDGRAVFYSGLKRGLSRKAALNAWQRTYERAVPLLAKVVAHGDLLHMRYEDLTANPARELQSICRFISLRFDRRMLDFRSRAHHVANGNDMRFRATAAIRIDDAWRRALTPSDLDYFEAHAGRLNQQLGYRPWNGVTRATSNPLER